MPTGSRRANGEGSISRKGDGWRACLRLDGKLIWGPVVRRKTDALPALKQKLIGLRRSSEATVADAVESYMASAKFQSLSPSTQVLNASHLRRRVLSDVIADLPLTEANRAVDAWLARQTGKPSTLRTAFNALKQALAHSGVDAVATTPPAQETEIRVLSSPETMSLMSLLQSAPRPIWIGATLCLECGLRPSEACGLQHRDRDEGGIVIRRALVRGPGGWYLKRPKTERRDPWVPLPEALLGVVGHGEPHHYVLTGSETPTHRDALWRGFKAVLRGTALEGTTLYDLRHTYAMRLLTSGVDPRTAAELMRHDPVMLLRTYARSSRALKVEAARKSAQKFARPQNDQDFEPESEHAS